MSRLRRFKAALPTGNYPDNPESLIRDDYGDYVLYTDVKKMLAEQREDIAFKINLIDDRDKVIFKYEAIDVCMNTRGQDFE